MFDLFTLILATELRISIAILAAPSPNPTNDHPTKLAKSQPFPIFSRDPWLSALVCSFHLIVFREYLSSYFFRFHLHYHYSSNLHITFLYLSGLCRFAFLLGAYSSIMNDCRLCLVFEHSILEL